MRIVILGAVLALLLPACGGGGTTAGLSTAALQGTVYEVGGQTSDRSGVQVRVLETGEVFLTDANGTFVFTGLRPGRYTLDFDTALNAASQLAENLEGEDGEGEGEGDGEGDGEGHGEGEGDEPTGGEGDDREGDGEGEGDEPKDEPRDDDCDGDDDRGEDNHEGEGEEDDGEDGEGHPVVDVPAEGGLIQMRVALDANGDVIEFSMGDHAERHAMAHLYRAEETDVLAGGKIKLTSVEGEERFKIAIHCLEPGTVVTLYIQEREAAPVLIGDPVADEEGEICFVAESGNLPLNAANLDELAGLRIEVRLAATDELILVGEVPDLPPELPHPDGPGDDEPGNDENGDDESGDDENGDDEHGDDESGDDENGDDESGDDETGNDEHGDGEPGNDEQDQ